jgi:hypothetical protein
VCELHVCQALWRQHALRWHGPRGGIERVRSKVSSLWGKVGNNEQGCFSEEGGRISLEFSPIYFNPQFLEIPICLTKTPYS